MGQAVRMMSYDRAANEANAIPALFFGKSALHWYRLDDGVMGGQSETLHKATKEEGSNDGDRSGLLHFVGQINTDGGGFASIRSSLPEGSITSDIIGVRITFRGDGKTYKFLLSDGQRNTGSPFSRSPSWQANIPSKDIQSSKEEWQQVDIMFDTLRASFGGSPSNRPSEEDRKLYKFDATSMGQVGLMLSLLLSDGSPNPKETFGEGIFPFSFIVKSMDPISSTPAGGSASQ